VTPEAKRDALEAGADGFLPKPIEVTRLLREIQALAALREEPRAAASSSARTLRPAQGGADVINVETLGHLEELGSSAAFVKKLAGVFLADNTQLLARIEAAVAARNYADFRAHLHAMKGSSASMVTDRLTKLCTALGAHSDAEIRLQAPQLVRSLSEELAAARAALERYVDEKQQSAS